MRCESSQQWQGEQLQQQWQQRRKGHLKFKRGTATLGTRVHSDAFAFRMGEYAFLTTTVVTKPVYTLHAFGRVFYWRYTASANNCANGTVVVDAAKLKFLRTRAGCSSSLRRRGCKDGWALCN